MWRIAAAALTALLAAGCASDRVTGPAGKIGASVSSFQSDLSGFQDAVKRLQSGEQSLAAGQSKIAAQMSAQTRQLQTEWALQQSSNASEIFKILQAQANTEIAAMKLQPGDDLVSAPLPLDKLAAVAKSLDELSKAPGTEADIEFLVGYGTAVKKQMDKSASPPPAAK